MALATTNVAYSKNFGFEGDQKVRYGTVTFTASYTASGEPVTPALFGLSKITGLLVGGTSKAGTRLISWDDTAGTQAAPGKLRVWTAIGTEATGASDQSAVTVTFKVIGY